MTRLEQGALTVATAGLTTACLLVIAATALVFGGLVSTRSILEMLQFGLLLGTFLGVAVAIRPPPRPQLAGLGAAAIMALLLCLRLIIQVSVFGNRPSSHLWLVDGTLVLTGFLCGTAVAIVRRALTRLAAA